MTISEESHCLLRTLRDDPRYPLDAYVFVQEALAYACNVLNLGGPLSEAAESAGSPSGAEEIELAGGERHLTGQQLCEAIRHFALDQFGYMARVVLHNWGIHSTCDFGNIVYNMIDVGLMNKSPEDRRSDFDNVYHFGQAFEHGISIAMPKT